MAVTESGYERFELDSLVIDMMSDFNSLHESERALLMSLHDNDGDVHRLSFVSRWRVTRLLARKPEALEFLEFLKRMSAQVSEAITAHSLPLNKSLWERIEQRINQEERAALYLGKRETLPERQSWLELFGISSENRGISAYWKIPGMALAACGLFVLGSVFTLAKGPLSNASPSTQGVDVSSNGANGEGVLSVASPVRFASQQGDLPQIIEPARGSRQTLSSVDVDWVHSDGAVRFYSDPQRNSTMIWVKKRSPVRVFGQQPLVGAGIGPVTRNANLQGSATPIFGQNSGLRINQDRH